jgi:SAM-dependent methyltransferase
MARGLPQQSEIADLLVNPDSRPLRGRLRPRCPRRPARPAPSAAAPAPHRPFAGHALPSRHRCRQWQNAGRVDIAAGTADQLPLPDAGCDTVVSTNTVVMWPDLAAGLQEIKRILRPNGRVVLSWHSAGAPSRTSQRLALSDDAIRRLSDALHVTFGDVRRHDLGYSIAWQAQPHE